MLLVMVMGQYITCRIMSEKFVIAVVGRPDAGKSSALLKLIERFPFINSSVPIYKQNHDMAVMREYLNEKSNQIKKLGICTIGDDIKSLEVGYVPLLIKNKCDIVVVACRNKRDVASNTFNYVADRAKENGYKFLTTSIIRYEPEFNLGGNDDENDGNTIISLLNEVFAENMINLIKRLS